jgi:hypothetical protein
MSGFVKTMVISLLFINLATAQPVESKPYLDWNVGEELLYRVKWIFLKLGEIKIDILDKVSCNERTAYHCQIKIDSRPGLPFVKIHDCYESYIDSVYFYSHLFRSYENKDNHTIITKYVYNPLTSQIDILMVKKGENSSVVLLDSTVQSPNRMFDSLSLFFLARGMVKNSAQVNLTLFVYNKFESTDINFTGNKNQIEFHGKNLDCFFLAGKLKFIGIGGVKDDFKGWFSPDSQSVPIKASMKAFIGRVKIELQQWKNWEKSIVNFDR